MNTPPKRFPATGFHPDSSVVERVVPSPNFEDRANLRRPDMIVLHYTGMESGDAALARLCDREAKVSSHYLVYENGSTVQMVPESLRASHAGVSSWEGETDTNSRSIGIEIVNPGHDFGYPAFPSRQIAAVIMLCKGILMRHTIRRENIVAHSDVAPARKQDPGEKFPWRLLYESGVGLWVEPAPITDWLSLIPGDSGETVRDLQQSLSSYGYGINVTGEYDEATKIVVTAFQRHFRPAQVDGMADTSTRDTLDRLLKAKANPPPPKETKNSPKPKA